MELTDQLYAMNAQWEDIQFDYPFKRHYFKPLLDSIGKKMIVVLIGPRRVGKTVLMKQLIQHFIDSGFEKRRILYFGFDDFKGEPYDIVNCWREQLALNLRESEYLIFFDEIQKIENWAQKIKIIYDSFPNISLILSGSSSAELRRGQESLAGREIRFNIDPLSFAEYLEIKKLEPISNELAWNYYITYMFRQLPALAISDLDPQAYVKEIVDKTIEHDIRSLFHVEDAETIRTIFRMICKSPGQIMRIEDISSEFGINRNTAAKYFRALEETLLIRKLYNYSKNPRKSEKRAKKYYPYYTTLHQYTQPYVPELSGLAETETAFQTKAEYFWNERNHEIDFITGNNLDIGVEVKMRKKINDSDLYWLLNASIPISTRIVVVPHGSSVRLSNNLNTIELHKIVNLHPIGTFL
ncbi:MAG: ATP-binding protein [Candidatus Micrarchaeota archaeon]